MIDLPECRENIKARIRSIHLQQIEIKHIILDASCINYVDSQGIQAILFLFEEFKSIDIAVHLSYTKRNLIE